MYFNVGDSKLSLIEGDITKIPADAIVNAANAALAGGGGVDGAIHHAGGPSIMHELDEIRARTGGCPTGEAVITGAGNLPARWVIHAVGPVFRDGRHGEPKLLDSCYRNSLQLARGQGARSVTFPSISTGAYGYPMAEAAEIAIGAVAKMLAEPACQLNQVTFVLFGTAAHETHLNVAQRLLAP